jgi:epoxyqueuosine reductase
VNTHNLASKEGTIKQKIREHGLALGFDKIGFAPAILTDEAPRLLEWLERRLHGEMQWMLKEPPRRTDANRSFPGTKTVICCGLNYFQGGAEIHPPDKGVISAYARGENYHRVLERKLDALASYIRDHFNVATKTYVDTGPLLEKSFAARAGLGWLGKHSNLLSRKGSSWFFLGEILVPLELPPDPPERNHCGSCSRCMTACPTDAIIQPYVVDSRLCISYLTIELRGFIPRELRPLIGSRIYGCDDCQDVCPWNRFAQKSEEAAFFPREPLASMDLIAMLRMSRDRFSEATRASAIRRARYAGFLRNVAVALGNSGDRGAVSALVEALDHPEPLVRGHVAWALGRLGQPKAIEPLRGHLAAEEVEEVTEEIRWALESLRSMSQ